MPNAWVLGQAIIIAVYGVLVFSGAVFADNCSGPADCQDTANYNTVVSVAGGAIAVVTVVVSTLLSGSAASITSGIIPPPLTDTQPDAPPEGGDPSPPTPADLGLPDTDPWDNPIEIRADGMVYWTEGYGDNGDGWITPERARGLLGEARQAVADRDHQRQRTMAAGERMVHESTARMVERNEEQARDIREANEALENARKDMENIGRIAERHDWEDILDRVDDKAYNEDGSLNVDYIRKLTEMTQNRIKRDLAAPDPDGTEPHWIVEGANKTLWDAKNSMVIRMGAGIMTGGTSEVAFQSMQAYEDLQKAVNEAVDKGEDFGFTDALRVGGKTFARENLPVNAIEKMMDPKATWTDVAIGGAMDIFVMMDVSETALNIKGSLNGARSGMGAMDILTHRSPDSIFAAIRRGPDLEASGPLWRTPLTDTPGYSHGPPPGGVKIDVPDDWGMPRSNVARVQDVAELHQVDIDIRRTNREAVARLSEGGVPKPQDIKAKTINTEDLLLKKNLSEGDIAKAGYFEPELPSRPPDMSDAEWGRLSPHDKIARGHPDLDPDKLAKLQRRYDQRMMEFHDRTGEMAKLAADGKFTVNDGIVHKVMPDGSTRPVTGDHDVYAIYDRLKLDADGNPTLIPHEIEIRNPRTGEMVTVPNPRYDAVVDSLKMPPFDAQHSAHLNWEPSKAADLPIRDNIVISHKPTDFEIQRLEPDTIRRFDPELKRMVEVPNPKAGQTMTLSGGEPLIRFRGDGSFPTDVFDEGTRLMGEYVGGGGL